MFKTAEPAALPLIARRLAASSLLVKGVAMLLGSLLIALSAQITVPMVPVPMTMQTFAILVVAALGGRTIGMGAIIAYLVEGAMGLPVFAGGAGGAHHLVGPTGGFLFGFLIAGGVIAYGVERGWGRDLVPLTVVLLAGHLVLFVPGVLWLANFVGVEKAITLGFVPFVIGTVLKTALAVATVLAAEKADRRTGADRA